jgi:hypothetical protein
VAAARTRAATTHARGSATAHTHPDDLIVGADVTDVVGEAQPADELEQRVSFGGIEPPAPRRRRAWWLGQLCR